MSEDGIREGHMVLVRNAKNQGLFVYVHERSDGYIELDGNYDARLMTPRQARHLARKLYRLARRIEGRTDG